jgi:hypothetical protein
MSTLKVTNIQSNAAGFNDVVSFQNSGGTQNGTLCRAWVNFNGTGTVAIRGNFNVSSITDNGTGLYTVNFTNAMTDANYSAVSNAGGASLGDGIQGGSRISTFTTGSVSLGLANAGGTLFIDANNVSASIFR